MRILLLVSIYIDPHTPPHPPHLSLRRFLLSFQGWGVEVCDSGSNPNHSLHRYRLGALELEFVPVFLFLLSITRL